MPHVPILLLAEKKCMKAVCKICTLLTWMHKHSRSGGYLSVRALDPICPSIELSHGDILDDQEQ